VPIRNDTKDPDSTDIDVIDEGGSQATLGRANRVSTDPPPDTNQASRIRLTIEGRGYTGEGWTRTADGFVSVPHTHPGDVVDVVLGPFHRGRAWAQIERFIHRDERHVDPECPHYAHCSGCALRHYSPAAESDFKLRMVAEIWDRHGPEMDQPLPLEFVSTGARSGHRTRGRMAVQVRSGQVHIGLRSLDLDRKTLDVRDCPAQSETWRSAMAWIGEWLDAHPDQAETVDQLDLRVDPSGAFIADDTAPWSHPNPAAARLLVDWTLTGLGSGPGTVLDLCCGTGTLTRALGAHFTRVISVDEDQRATSALKNAELPRVEVRTGRLGKVLRKLRREGLRARAAVINPMRRPLGLRQLRDLTGFGLETVVYLGPSPLSTAKDARLLAELGFWPVRAAAIDLHPATAQVMMGVVFTSTFPRSPGDI
jgi:tRNA/tmRNA/rRNA uracil-C5-methylase (TrmA/RlmC/RlmD family)